MDSTVVRTLREMWLAGEAVEVIGSRFGIAVPTVYKWVRRYNIPPRPNASQAPQVDDPTPLQIAQRCAVIKARHLAELAAESLDATQRRVGRWNA